MRNWFLLVFFCAIQVGCSVSKYRIAPPPGLEVDLVGGYDINNEDWLSGYSVDALWLTRRGEDNKPLVYIGPNHLFNASREGAGSIGLSVGAWGSSAGHVIYEVVNLISPDHSHRLKWLEKTAEWLTFEGHVGYHAFGSPEGTKSLVYGAAGKVKVPTTKLQKFVSKLFRK